MQVPKGTCRNEACCLDGVDECQPFTYSELDPPTLGCDPPIQLLDSALQTMGAIQPSPDFLFFTGDMPAHRLCTGEGGRRSAVAAPSGLKGRAGKEWAAQ